MNLSPADLPKEGSHFDLPIALGLLAAIGATDAEGLAHYVAVGELSLDGRIASSPGVLLAALHAAKIVGRSDTLDIIDVLDLLHRFPCFRRVLRFHSKYNPRRRNARTHARVAANRS